MYLHVQLFPLLSLQSLGPPKWIVITFGVQTVKENAPGCQHKYGQARRDNLLHAQCMIEFQQASIPCWRGSSFRQWLHLHCNYHQSRCPMWPGHPTRTTIRGHCVEASRTLEYSRSAVNMMPHDQKCGQSVHCSILPLYNWKTVESEWWTMSLHRSKGFIGVYA